MVSEEGPPTPPSQTASFMSFYCVEGQRWFTRADALAVCCSSPCLCRNSLVVFLLLANTHSHPVPGGEGDADFWGVVMFRQCPYIRARNQLLCVTFPPTIPAAQPCRRSCFHMIFDFSGRLSLSPSESSQSGPDPGQDRRSGICSPQ